jgi:hypothetical protein
MKMKPAQDPRMVQICHAQAFDQDPWVPAKLNPFVSSIHSRTHDLFGIRQKRPELIQPAVKKVCNNVFDVFFLFGPSTST